MRLQRRLLAGGTIIAGAVVGGHALPNGYAWGCLNISKSLPFCDHALPMEVRTQDLVSRLTLREKISLLGADTKNTNVGSCDCMDYGVERLGIPKYMNLVSHSEIGGSPNRIVGRDPSYSPCLEDLEEEPLCCCGCRRLVSPFLTVGVCVPTGGDQLCRGVGLPGGEQVRHQLPGAHGAGIQLQPHGVEGQRWG